MRYKNYAGAILALLIIFASCAGAEQELSTEQQREIDSLSVGVTSSQEVKSNYVLLTQFITEEGSTYKEEKSFVISENTIVVGKDTIFVDSKRDSVVIGYDIISFPRNKVRPHYIEVGSNSIEIDGVRYTNTIVTSTRKKKTYKILPGDTRSVLLSKGIPVQFIPKIPQVGKIINYE